MKDLNYCKINTAACLNQIRKTSIFLFFHDKLMFSVYYIAYF